MAAFARQSSCVVLLVLWLAASAWAEQVGLGDAMPVREPVVMLPKVALGPDDLAVIVNDADPLSVEIAAYYQKKRAIPSQNMIHVRFNVHSAALSESEFSRIKQEVEEKMPRSIQAYALTWAKPYRVGCMSITTAFAAGFDKAYCAQGCALTKPSPYFNSASNAPFHDFRLRPAMSIAAENIEQARSLIDRGVAADHTFPMGTAYLADTTDKARNVRSQTYSALSAYARGWLQLDRVRANVIEYKTDVLFYFTGLAKVDGLASNTFLPGAIADHLTSAGGKLTDSSQMSSLRWLEAGATGSYGAVVEPCNFLAKFPNPAIVVAHYTAGESLIEAYWKSVAMPGQGIFIGEPLARPFGGYKTEYKDGMLSIISYLPPGVYSLFAADSAIGPYRALSRNMVLSRGRQEIKLRNADANFYKIVPNSRVSQGLERTRKDLI